MAVATLLGVYPVSLLIGVVLSSTLRKLPLGLNLLVVSTLIVSMLTWVVMPFVTRLLHGWLNPQPQKNERNS
jgi:antibiotic biosynthesis monooxygenase (ABM) superfamily enzyme